MTARRTKKRFQTNVSEIEFQTFQRNNPHPQLQAHSHSMPQKKQTVYITPRNLNQKEYLSKLLDQSKNIVFALGPAGTGKTLIACQVGIKLFKEGLVDKIVVTRPAVAVDEEHGFLPGTLEQKMAPWTRPIFDVLSEYYYSREIENMIREGIIEISPLAYMRGRNFENSFIILDEAQNTTPSQIKMALTRISAGSKMVITGDLAQHDRGYEKNGLLDFTEKLKLKQSSLIDIVEFVHSDIQRHPAVKEVLSIYGEE
jgi:phosphate starvation-inducible PhoH-like protein